MGGVGCCGCMGLLFRCEISGALHVFGLFVDVVVEVWCCEVGFVAGLDIVSGACWDVGMYVWMYGWREYPMFMSLVILAPFSSRLSADIFGLNWMMILELFIAGSTPYSVWNTVPSCQDKTRIHPVLP